MSRQTLQQRSASVAALIWAALFVLLLTRVDPGATPVSSSSPTIQQFVADAEEQPATDVTDARDATDAAGDVAAVATDADAQSGADATGALGGDFGDLDTVSFGGWLAESVEP